MELTRNNSLFNFKRKNISICIYKDGKASVFITIPKKLMNRLKH
ncbi:hypothetical protein [Apilactobacillus micheneri]|nr:hypothetical protein [Apilactobacillus micheneri]